MPHDLKDNKDIIDEPIETSQLINIYFKFIDDAV